ncbi:MFS transporter [Bacillus sp. FJAT-47783]|uniref:MFS transporter n=1 Tax=Bacillus sp. FJAT-47783 TaxID=2922712 RepID=UPI001FAD042D|nr:MFS transporter [Bacillus sp. FJAT-47783]
MKSIFRESKNKIIPILLSDLFTSVGSGITMIAIPWYLVNQPGGEKVFGLLTIISTTALFLLSPYFGAVIDKFSQKRLLMLTEGFGAIITLLLGILCFLTNYDQIAMVTLSVIGTMITTFYYQVRFALNQSLFKKEQYNSLNSTLEIQTQGASLLVGALATVAVETIDISYILILNSVAYLVSLTALTILPNIHRKKAVADVKNSRWKDIQEGFNYVKYEKKLMLFLLCAFMPFIAVMVGNYLFPVFIAQYLKANASTMGLLNLFYSSGAIIGSIIVTYVVRKIGSLNTTVITMLTYTLALVCTVIFNSVFLFLVFMLFCGAGNSGTRISRNTLMMEIIPQDIIGRVNGFLQAAGLLMRVTLVFIFTLINSMVNVRVSLLVLSVILVLSFIIVFTTRKGITNHSLTITEKGIDNSNVIQK